MITAHAVPLLPLAGEGGQWGQWCASVTLRPLSEPFAIDARNLSRRYGRRWALVDVSLQVAPGQVCMVAGANGSGKSTLLRILATAIRPDVGKATVGGFDVVSQRDEVRSMSAHLGHYSYLYESLTARENLELIRRPVDDVLQRVGLAERADDVVSTFSAGMRKRLSFARVLLQEATVVLLDEPYGQLDPAGFALVEDVVSELRQRKVTVVIATHQVERVGKYSDARLLLEAGRTAK